MPLPDHLEAHIIKLEEEARTAHVALRLVHDDLQAGNIERAKERAAKAVAELRPITRTPTNPATLISTGALDA